jgi:dCTP deaminase
LGAALDEAALRVIPRPQFDADRSGEASVDLRLGRWFRTLRQSRTHILDITESDDISTSESRLTKEYFVRFDDSFVLHPGKFVLGITLEWLGLPAYLSGYVTGRSSWGRRGLIIETAAGIQPGFKGCLTLELTNVGEAPIALWPGMRICQVFFHTVENPGKEARGQFTGRRKPILGQLRADNVVRRLRGDS